MSVAPPQVTVNECRGEVVARINGKSCTLRLTLGELAHLEKVFEHTSLLQLAQQFDEGKFGAGDCIQILAAGLRGGGAPVDEAELAAWHMDGGISGWLRLVGTLLRVTFQSPDPRSK